VGLWDMQMIQHRNDIRHGDGPGLGSPVMRFVTGAMPTGIDQDEPVVVPQRLHIPPLVPIRQIAVKAMQEHQRRVFPFHLVMHTDALIGGVWHTNSSPQYQMVQHLFFFIRKRKIEPNAQDNVRREAPLGSSCCWTASFLIERIPIHPNRRRAELLPWAWKAARAAQP
jgi:hypothetical protein